MVRWWQRIAGKILDIDARWHSHHLGTSTSTTSINSGKALARAQKAGKIMEENNEVTTIIGGFVGVNYGIR